MCVHAASRALPGGASSSVALEPEVPMTAEEKEQAAARANFLAGLAGEDSDVLDTLMQGSDGAAARGGIGSPGGSGLISLDGADDADADLGLDEANVRRAAPRATFDPASVATPPALGPSGAMTLAQLQRQQATQAADGNAGAVTAPDVWADLGLDAPDLPQADGEGGIEDGDPFAAFGDFALSSPTAPAAAEAASPVYDFAASGSPDARAATAQPASSLTAGSLPDGAAPIPQDAGSSAAAGPTSGAHAQHAAAPPQDRRGGDVASTARETVGTASAADALPGFLAGVQAMFGGAWQQALACYAHAFQAAAGELRALVSQYIAAVCILEAFPSSSEAQSCRLSRYLAAMPLLQLDHASFLVHDAVGRNGRAGNYWWAAKRLEAFAAQCMRLGRVDLAQGASSMVQQVLAAGRGNRSVPDGEDPARFLTGVNAAQSVQDVVGVVSSLQAGLL